MAECHRAVMGIIALDQHMTIEPLHLRNGKDADAAEGTGGNRKDLTVGHISPQPAVSGALEAEECDVARGDISLKGTLSYFLRKTSCHDQLVFHLAEGQLLRAGVAAVEAHEHIVAGVVIFALDVLIVEIVGHRVVDIQKRHHIIADAGSDELA